jgi:hypothetical protein
MNKIAILALLVNIMSHETLCHGGVREIEYRRRGLTTSTKLDISRVAGVRNLKRLRFSLVAVMGLKKAGVRILVRG